MIADGTPAELKRRIPGGHVQLHFADPSLLRSASELLPQAASDPDRLVLQAPADGTVDALRGLLNELYEAQDAVERLTIHTPDLDDVFLAVTGSQATDPDGVRVVQGAPQRPPSPSRPATRGRCCAAISSTSSGTPR